jgi:hypothetical protein
MFIAATRTPVPYSLEYDRRSTHPTRWYLTPQSSLQTQTYNTRYLALLSDRELTDDVRAMKTNELDKETLLGTLAKVENGRVVDDVIEDRAELITLVNDLDNESLQELLKAAQRASLLRAQQKNS